MNKTLEPGFTTIKILTIVIGVVLALAGNAFANDEPIVETDPTCSPIYVSREKIADSKQTRIDSRLFDDLQGKTIRRIHYNTMDVFDPDDPDENNALYMFLNKLHVNTRPKVIAAQLTFEEGDPLDIKRIEESERILRRRPYLTNAFIIPATKCAEQVDLMVVTQDSWALEPQFSVSKESEGTTSGFAISDGNILGSGNSLTVGYEQNNERNLINYDFRNPHIFNSQIATKLYYADTSDGRDTIVDISHPFYSLETPWSAGFYTQDVTLEEAIRHMDEEINEFQYQSRNNQIFFGIATDVQKTHTQRWLIGFSNEEDDFYPTEKTMQGIPTPRKAVYPWIEYQYLESRYGVFKNINQIQRPEDIALGHNLSFRLGYGGTAFDNEDDVIRYIGKYSYILDFDLQHIFETTVTLNGRHHNHLENANSAIASINFAYNYFEDEKRRWYMGVVYNIGQDLAQYEELTIGDMTGLRGYPTDFQRGEKSYVFTVERRYFSDWHIFNLLRVGAVAFFDVGKAWGLEQYGYSPTLSNVGFGLRLSSSKVRIGNVVHIDVATPMTARDGVDKYQLTIGAQQKF